ncbi:hypothetical protein F4775DRAFT_605899 [Biscogniauxia sp. FL1348]|nr:hypothetical protein F4775DRAFT_605899 [Biscogniauxia sp. FL1348]
MVGPTRYTDEQINFILDRTVRDVPRGETVNLHLAVARDFREAYDEPDFGLNQVRYVTERYGSDPDYGNRWGKLVRPVSQVLARDTGVPAAAAATTTPGARRLARARGRLALCAHCGGTGVQALDEPGQQQQHPPPPGPEAGHRPHYYYSHRQNYTPHREEIPTSHLRDTRTQTLSPPPYDPPAADDDENSPRKRSASLSEGGGDDSGGRVKRIRLVNRHARARPRSPSGW